MKLKNLSSDPRYPLWLCDVCKVRILFDFPINFSKMHVFEPKHPLLQDEAFPKLASHSKHSVHSSQLIAAIEGSDFVRCALALPLPFSYLNQAILWDTIDLVLISNFENIQGLPFIYSQESFKGIVLATEPTIQYGRQLLEDLVLATQELPRCVDLETVAANNFAILKNKNISSDILDCLKSCVSLFPLSTIENAFSLIQKVSFNEKIALFDGRITVFPVSAGYCIGSCNWIVECNDDRLAYMSSSSQWSCHPTTLNIKELVNLNALIFNGLSSSPGHLPDVSIEEMSSSLVHTLQQGGNVLFPCYPCGITYDLIETVANTLDSNNLQRIPMYFISTRARHSLSFADIYGEWLSSGKQDKIYTADAPFSHSELVTLGRLKCFDNLHGDFNKQFTTPAVVFTGHPSLRAGEVVHFMKLWGDISTNCIILTNIQFSTIEVVAPFQPLSARVLFCPLDMQLQPKQANILLDKVKPKNLILPRRYEDICAGSPEFSLTVPPGTNTHWVDYMDIVEIDIESSEDKVELVSSISKEIMPVEVSGKGLHIAPVTGVLTYKNGKRQLDALPSENTNMNANSKFMRLELDSGKKRPILVGRFSPDDFVSQLQARNFLDAKYDVAEDGSYTIFLELGSQEALITVDGDATHIYCDDEKIRLAVRDALLACLSAV